MMTESNKTSDFDTFIFWFCYQRNEVAKKIAKTIDM